ncbi:hypothetical protein [Mycobacterium sp. pR1184]|uniref:hypothetical protein n=1 Tax=Mycobacterium sp. pR1184 TaxID=3238981 RepID=UPI00351AE4EB
MSRVALRRRSQRDSSDEDTGKADECEAVESGEDVADADGVEAASGVDSEPEDDSGRDKRRRGMQWRRALTYGILPVLALIMAMGAGYLKWYDWSARESRLAASESVRAASDGAVAMLSYRPDTVEKDLGAARDRLTGSLKDSYSSLTHEVVIPGSKQKRISATASVPAAAAVSASPNHAVVLMFVNQTIVEGTDPPTNTASRVRVTLDKSEGRWLISSFDPI